MRKLLEFIVAILISTFLFPLGFIFNIFNIWNFKKFVKYYWISSKEVVKVIFGIFRQLAIFLDILGNVIAGRLFFFMFTNKENQAVITYFGLSGWTISASIGHLEYYNRLNKFGLKFSKFLSVALYEKDHCLKSYKWKLYKEKFNK